MLLTKAGSVRYAQIAASLPEDLAAFCGIGVPEAVRNMETAKEERNRAWAGRAPQTEAAREELYRSLGKLDLFKYARWHLADTEKQHIHDRAVAAARVVGGPILDCGGGIGDTTLLFALHQLPVTYVDFPGLCLDFARFRWQKFGCAEHVRVLTPEHFWTLEDASFGVVVSIDVLEHLENPVKHAARYHALLRPGGQLFITASFRHNTSNPDHLPENDGYRRIFGGERKTARRCVLRNLGFGRKHWYQFVKVPQ